MGDPSAQVDDLVSYLTLYESSFPRAVDVWSFQLYRGISFGTFFDDYARFQLTMNIDKPLLITEFGLDALDFRIGRYAHFA
jgi:hypothetical protein